MGRLLTTAQVAELTTLSEGTLRWLRHQGRGPQAHKLGQRRVVYRQEDVEAWIEANLTNSAGPAA